MWFELIDGTIRFTHTTTRAEYKALRKNPGMRFVVFDPDVSTHYIEVRGALVETIPDPGGSFFQQLARRYGHESPSAPADAANRIVLVVSMRGFGTGKAHLLIALGIAAAEQGHRVRSTTTAGLVNELIEAADDHQLSKVVARLLKMVFRKRVSTKS